MKIVLVTSGQPSLNPRLVKEADALSDAGYNVTVLYTYWNDWGTKFDVPLLRSKNWKAIRVGGDPEQKPLGYLFSRIIHKAAIAGVKKAGLKYFAEYAISRNSYWLMKATLAHHADLYIAHNLGALPAVVKAARRRGKPCGFDAEDFHRYEVTNDTSSYQYTISKYIEDKYLLLINYMTASSPLIADKYNKFYPGKNPVTILNVFPKNKTANLLHKSENGSIKLFWFSQTIGSGRGLNTILHALKLLNDHPFELHLLGRCDSAFKERVDTSGCQVYFHEPVNPDGLVEFAMQFDIGIASERKTPLNRDICLTNKIFTYMQSGLAIIASNTTAQQAFLNQYPAIGQIFEQDNIESLTYALQYYLQNRDKLTGAREASLQLAREKYNWELESTTFLETVQKTLNIT